MPACINYFTQLLHTNPVGPQLTEVGLQEGKVQDTLERRWHLYLEVMETGFKIKIRIIRQQLSTLSA